MTRLPRSERNLTCYYTKFRGIPATSISLFALVFEIGAVALWLIVASGMRVPVDAADLSRAGEASRAEGVSSPVPGTGREKII
jgi:hypothetical protein